MNNFQNNHFGTIINNHFAYYKPDDKFLLIHFMNNEKDPQQATLIDYQRSKVPCKFMTFIKHEGNRRVKTHFIIPKKMKDDEIAQIYLHQNINSITFLSKNEDEVAYKVSDNQKIKYKLIDPSGKIHIQEIEIKGQNLRIIDLLLSIYNQENKTDSSFVNLFLGKLTKKYDAALPKFKDKELKFWEPLSTIFADDKDMISIEAYKGSDEMDLLNLVNSSTKFDKIPFEGRLKTYEIISNYCKKNKMSELRLRLYSDFNMLNPNDIPSLLKPRYNFLILNQEMDKKKLILKNSTKFQCELVIESKNFDKCADIIKGMFNLPEGELTFSCTVNGKYYFLEQSFDAGCFPDNFEIILTYQYKHLNQMTFRYGGITKVLKINVDSPIELIIPVIQREFDLWNYSKKAIKLSFFSFDFPHDQSFSYYKFPETAIITISTNNDAFPLQIAKLGSKVFNDYYFVNGEKIQDLIDHFKNQYNQDIYPYKNSDGKIQISTTKELEKSMKLYISGEFITVKYIGSSSNYEFEVNSILTVEEASKFLRKKLKRKVHIFTKNKDDNSYDPATENKQLFELEGQLFAHKFFKNIEFNYTIFSKPQHISDMNTVKWLKEKYISRQLLICVDDFIIKKNDKKLDDEVKIGEALKNFNGLLEIFIETGINKKSISKRETVSKFKPVTDKTSEDDKSYDDDESTDEEEANESLVSKNCQLEACLAEQKKKLANYKNKSKDDALKIAHLESENLHLKEKLSQFEQKNHHLQDLLVSRGKFESTLPFFNFDDYKVESVIGDGATSCVKLVSKRELYAMKELKSFDHKTVKRFLSEAEILFILRHPCILGILAVNYGDDEHPPSIILELEPTSLEKAISSGSLDESQKCMATVELVLGMRYIHNRGFMHRDLKPSNILLTKKGHVRICDFGLVKEDNIDTTLSIGVGTPRFMAPEILAQDEGSSAHYTNKVDVYSFGVTLIYIVSGSYPVFNMKNAVLGILPPLPESMKEWVKELIVRCMSIEPENRPSFAEIFDILKEHNYDLFSDGIGKKQSMRKVIDARVLKIEACEFQSQKE